MRRFCALWRPLMLSVGAVILGTGGCPNDQLAGQLSGLLNDALNGGVTEAQVADVLNNVLGNDATAAAADTQAISETSTLTEEEIAKIEGDPQEVDVSENDVLDSFRGGGDNRPIDQLVLDHGRLVGRFMSDPPGGSSDNRGGTFVGRWFDADDQVRGHLEGEYHPLPPDQLPPGIVGGGIFRGRYIGNNGEFRGFLRGRYGHAREGRGVFVGQWRDRENRLLGMMRGHWEDVPNSPGGRFGGIWAAFNVCDEADGLLDDSSTMQGSSDDAGFDPQTTDELDALQSDLDGLIDAEAAQPDAFAAEQDALSLDGVDSEPDVSQLHGPCVDNAGFIRGWHMPGLPDGFDPNTPADGVWRANWRDVSNTHHGEVRGLWRFRHHPGDGDPNMGDPNGVDPNAPGDPNMDPGDGGPQHPHVRGVFVGRVFNADGNPIGHIRGVFGVGRHGLGVFRARFINLDGVRTGILRGRWNKAPDRRGGPLFGMWLHVNRDGDSGG